MNGKPNEIPPPKAPTEPAWVRWWRANPTGKPFPHVETKGARKRTRRERRGR